MWARVVNVVAHENMLKTPASRWQYLVSDKRETLYLNYIGSKENERKLFADGRLDGEAQNRRVFWLQKSCALYDMLNIVRGQSAMSYTRTRDCFMSLVNSCGLNQMRYSIKLLHTFRSIIHVVGIVYWQKLTMLATLTSIGYCNSSM